MPKVSRRTLVACLFTVAWGLAPHAAVQKPSTSPVVIPFELVTHHILIKGTVNGSRPLSFVFDTGANQALVRMDVAKELNLALEGDVHAGGAGGGMQSGSQVRRARYAVITPRTLPGRGRARKHGPGRLRSPRPGGHPPARARRATTEGAGVCRTMPRRFLRCAISE